MTDQATPRPAAPAGKKRKKRHAAAVSRIAVAGASTTAMFGIVAVLGHSGALASAAEVAAGPTADPVAMTTTTAAPDHHGPGPGGRGPQGAGLRPADVARIGRLQPSRRAGHPLDLRVEQRRLVCQPPDDPRPPSCRPGHQDQGELTPDAPATGRGRGTR
jgi:hypothetical protein